MHCLHQGKSASCRDRLGYYDGAWAQTNLGFDPHPRDIKTQPIKLECGPNYFTFKIKVNDNKCDVVQYINLLL